MKRAVVLLSIGAAIVAGGLTCGGVAQAALTQQERTVLRNYSGTLCPDCQLAYSDNNGSFYTVGAAGVSTCSSGSAPVWWFYFGIAYTCSQRPFSYNSWMNVAIAGQHATFYGRKPCAGGGYKHSGESKSFTIGGTYSIVNLGDFDIDAGSPCYSR